MIYDYLFYKGHQLGKWSKNFDDMPVLAGVIWVVACFMFNIFTIALLIEIVGFADTIIFDKKYKFIFSLSLVLLLILYYTYKGRYHRIVERYEEKERLKGKGVHPIIVIAIYYVITFVILIITAMYKNGDGIFK